MNFCFVVALLILTFMCGMILGTLLTLMDQKEASKARKVTADRKAPHFYDLRA